MHASYMENGGRPERPESEGAREVEVDEAGHITIEDAIRLTARFEREWFRSPQTLDEDLVRFAAAYRLSTEEAQQVRRVMEALEDGEGKEGLGYSIH